MKRSVYGRTRRLALALLIPVFFFGVAYSSESQEKKEEPKDTLRVEQESLPEVEYIFSPDTYSDPGCKPCGDAKSESTATEKKTRPRERVHTIHCVCCGTCTGCCPYYSYCCRWCCAPLP
jgi:hypothetical protein